MCVHGRRPSQNPQGLNNHLGAFDVSDEWYGIVHGHAPRPVALCSEGGGCSRPSVPHRKVDDQIEFVL